MASVSSAQLYLGNVVGLTTSPQRLAPTTTPGIREVVIQADPGNVGNVLVGNATFQLLVLVPGQGLSIPINNLSSIWVKMASGTGTVTFLARD
jgi:hypothetical protein